MARREKSPEPADIRDTTPDEPVKRSSAFRLWLEEAWEGWLKSIGVLILAAIAYVLYKFDLVGEPLAGVAIVAAVVLGAVFSTALPAWHLLDAKPPVARALFVVLVATWVGGTGYPAMRTALQPRPLAEGRLTTEKPTTEVKVDHLGPYELAVSGHFKQAGMANAEASYTIKVTGGGGTDEISDVLKRELKQFRAGRRGGTSTALLDQTELSHRLPHVRGGQLTFSTEAVDEQLDGGLTLTVRPAALNPIIFLVLSGLALLLSIGFDARLGDRKSKTKTYLSAAVGFCLVFAIAFPAEATPHSLVRPAVGALVLSTALGALGGWLLGAIGRLLFGPKLVKARK